MSTAGYTMHQSGFWFKDSNQTGPFVYTSAGMVSLSDEANAGFYAGRQFRAHIELAIPAGGTMWVRHTMNTNFELHDQRVSIKSGSVKWQAIAATSSSPGPWTPKTPRRRNQMNTVPAYVSTNIIEISSDPAAVVGGIEVDLLIVSAEGLGGQSASIVQNAGLRGLPPGVFHVKMFNESNETAVGVYDWWWEEKP